MRALTPFSSASIVEYEQVNAYWANTKIWGLRVRFWPILQV